MPSKTEAPTWAERVRAILDETKLSRTDLASLLGVSENTIGRWLRGEASPHVQAVVRALERMERSAP